MNLPEIKYKYKTVCSVLNLMRIAKYNASDKCYVELVLEEERLKTQISSIEEQVIVHLKS